VNATQVVYSEPGAKNISIDVAKRLGIKIDDGKPTGN
jgi:hypothetical protein